MQRGLKVAIPGEPSQAIESAKKIGSVGILGADYPGIRFELAVEAGAHVAKGTPLARDQKRPEIAVRAPVSGIISGIEFGSRRRLRSIAMTVGNDSDRRFAVPENMGRDELQSLLLDSGLWVSFKTRPFGRIPDVGRAPDAIFATAVDSRPHAADPDVVIASRGNFFGRGVAAIARLTDGPVFVCQKAGDDLVAQTEQIRCANFSGPHPAGLAGTHIDRLYPLGRAQREVWEIGYQDVIAIGALIETGMLETNRIISLAGPGIRRPHLIDVPQGAALDDLAFDELADGGPNVFSGSPLCPLDSPFLSRYHWQATALFQTPFPDPDRRGFLGSDLRSRPIIPTEALELAIGPDIPIVPLLRALSSGDTESAARLGCIRLLDEDMELINYAVGGSEDFAHLLRATLNILEQEH